MTTTGPEKDPTDWDDAYVTGSTMWDIGQPLAFIPEAIASGLFGEPGTVLCPGAGRGHDAAGFAAAGWKATVLDISPTAQRYAAEHYPEVAYVVADALDPAAALAATGGPVDLLWDHTFFCAVPPEWRPRIGALAAAVVRPGGLVASGVFPVDRDRGEEGPPWTYVADDMTAVLGSGFELVHLSEQRQLFTRLPWGHRLGIWRRTDSSSPQRGVSARSQSEGGRYVS